MVSYRLATATGKEISPKSKRLTAVVYSISGDHDGSSFATLQGRTEFSSPIMKNRHPFHTYATYGRTLLLLAGYAAGTSSFAQNTNLADIRGTVTDITGAVVPGVTVTVLDVDKGDTRIFTTDGAGLYDTGSIVADHYKLTFTKDGFQTLVRGPLTLDVGVQGINVSLQTGSTTQEVTVNTDVPLLDTESGAQEQTRTAETMAQLPPGRQRLAELHLAAARCQWNTRKFQHRSPA